MAARTLSPSRSAMTCWRTATGRSRSPRAPGAGPVVLDRPGESEQLVLDLLEIGARHPFEHRGGVPRHPVARAHPPEDRLVVGLAVASRAAGRRRATGWPASGRTPRHPTPAPRSTAWWTRRPPRAGPARQQVVEDGPSRRHWNRTVVDGQGQLGVGIDQGGHAVELGRGLGQRAGLGQRLLHGGQVALEGWVHRPPPAAPAAAPLSDSARTAAMASSIRSWWSEARISRPMTRSAAASTISPTWR